MLEGMIDSIRGCLKEEIRMDVISNNLSNSNVIGFKRDKVSFREVLTRVAQEAPTSPLQPTGESDAATMSIKTDMQQGDFRLTGNQYDFAINGRGFFKIDTPAGIRFTRKGSFTLDVMGRMITQEGHLVLGLGGPINMPPAASQISIDRQGNISADNKQLGRFDLVDFEDYDGLRKEGSGYFVSEIGDPGRDVPEETRLNQGVLELSNVDVTGEMVQMIHSLRAFESYQKTIQVLDGMNNRVINEVSRVR